MSLDNDFEASLNFSQKNTLAMLGANANVPIPGYIDSAGTLQTADAANPQEEAFGLIEVVDGNTLVYIVEDPFIPALSHGFNPGDILYLQDGGGLGTSPGTNMQKIYEVVSADVLHYLKQPMFKTVTSNNGVARYKPLADVIVNTGTPWNQIKLNPNANFDTQGFTVSPATNSIEIPEDGIYGIVLHLNFFDDNSPRVAHRTEIQLNGGNLHGADASIVEGENYMRDATFHDSASIRHIDTARLTQGDLLTFRIQSTSSTANTTDLTGGWITLKKL